MAVNAVPPSFSGKNGRSPQSKAKAKQASQLDCHAESVALMLSFGLFLLYILTGTGWKLQSSRCVSCQKRRRSKQADLHTLKKSPYFGLCSSTFIHYSYDESPIPILKISVDYIKQFCDRRKGDTGSQNSKDLISSNQWVFYLKNNTQGSKFKTNQCCKIRLQFFGLWCKNVRQMC